jgi:L,D-transpeptidase catalytic domain/Putative peptidoglycan binding domain
MTRHAGARWLVLLAFACLVLLPAAVADAQAASSVTLTASATKITVGEEVTLAVQIDPATAGETVSIVDAGGSAVASGVTGAAGRFETTISPSASVRLEAEWGPLVSDPVVVGVRAVVHVDLGTVRLFDNAVVTGSVRPAVPGAGVDLTLIRDGRAISARSADIGARGGFRTRFAIPLPGSYRVRARFADADHLAGVDLDGPRSTPLPTLRTGSKGVYVRLLERRLVDLHYRLVGIDASFDFRTADAVMAFRKVQRMQRTTIVDEAVWRALARPAVPHPRIATDGFHVEVDQTRQVLYTVQDGAVTNVIHVSTGKPSTPTRDGSFSVTSKLAGYSDHLLYYPSFFDGQRAIHGWPDVPSYAASHGCVRVPYWHAKWIFGLTPVGTRVVVYH